MEDLDSQFASAFGGGSDSGGSLEDQFANAFGGPKAAPVSSHPATARAQQRPSASPFHAAVAPDQPEMSWHDTFSEAGKNLLPSAGGVLAATGNALIHPIDTLNTLGDLGKGALSQASGAVGLPSFAPESEKKVRALEDHYGNTYGSVKGFKQALAKDPASILMDASTVIGGGAGLVGKAATAGSTTAKIAGGVGKAAGYLDPVNDAVGVAKLASKPVGSLIRGTQEVLSGTPSSLLQIAKQAGSAKDPELRAAFNNFRSGRGDPSEFLTRAQSALKGIRDDASAEYLANKAKLSNSTINLSGAQQKIAELKAKLGSGASGGFPKAKEALAEAEAMVNELASHPNAARRSLNEIDSLKRQIHDLHDSYRNPEASSAIDGVYHSIRDALADPKLGGDAGYADLMENYQQARAQLKDLQSGAGAGSNAVATNALTKSLKAFKTGKGGDIFAKLAEKDKALPYMLAGHSVRNWSPGGGRTVLEAVLAPMMYGIHPTLPFAQFAASSPRLAGNMAYGSGRAQGIQASALGQAAQKGAYYADRTNESLSDEVPTAPAGDFGKILQIESGGKHFQDNGNVMTSPKGAIGAAQIMPGTGPEAAAAAGEPWSLERLKSDAQYNMKLGKALFEKHLREFGDPVKAAAAYNAGAERVKRALRFGEDWISHLPPETINYIRKYTTNAATGGRINRARGGKVDDIEPLVSRLMVLAKRTKKATDKSTESLLAVPDEHIVKALDIAQKAI